MPVRLNVPAVALASEQVPLSVTITLWPEPAAVSPVQTPEKPVNVVTVEIAGTVVPVGKVTVIVDPALKTPVADGVRPIVQVVVAEAVVLVGTKVTAVGAVAAVKVIPLAGLTVAESEEVATLKVVFASVGEPVGFVIPEREKVPAVPAARAHVPLSVTVTV